MTAIPKSRSIIIVGSIFFALGILLGGTALAEFLDPKLLGLLTLLFVAARGGWDYFVNASANVDANRVAVVMTDAATPVAGEASPVTTGEALHPGDTIQAVTPKPIATTNL